MDGENKGKNIDEIYCSECGKLIKKTAVFCEHCGTKLKDIQEYQHKPVQNTAYPVSPKSKAVAITLAVIFGFWSWLYTYRRDAKKFWVYLCILLPGSIGISIFVNMAVTGIGTNAVFYNYGTWVWLYFLVLASASIWALVNSIKRPNSFYENYPN